MEVWGVRGKLRSTTKRLLQAQRPGRLATEKEVLEVDTSNEERNRIFSTHSSATTLFTLEEEGS